MKFGTLLLQNKVYDLDFMKKSELEDLFYQNNKDKTMEITNAKKICKREIDENLRYNVEDIPNRFKFFMDNSSIYCKSEAIIQRALIQKNSYDIISEKVNQKKNAVNESIKKINSKFNRYNKKYEEIKDNIDKCLKKYESILYRIADFYDAKIEQLILNKLELEAHLVGSIIKDEYLIEEEIKRKDQKDNDKLLLSLSNSIKNFIKKISNKKEQNKKEHKEIDVKMIIKLQDKAELEEEQKNKLNNLVENTINLRKENLEKIDEYEKEIFLIEKEIKRLNENKENSIIEAMESSSKDIEICQKNKKILGKLKIFFKEKLNPSAVIYENIINPMNEYISSLEKNYIENFK